MDLDHFPIPKTLLERKFNENYRTDYSFRYLMEQISAMNTPDIGSNRSTILFYISFIANGKFEFI